MSPDMASDFTVIQSQRQHFGNEPGSFNDIEPDVPFAGAAKDFLFDCPHVDPSETAFLVFQSRDVDHRKHIFRVNGIDVYGGLPVSPARDAWNANILLLEPRHELRDAGNVLHIESRNANGGSGGDIDDFIIDNMVIEYKTRVAPTPDLAGTTARIIWYSAGGAGANTILDTPLRRFLFQRSPRYVIYNSETDGYQAAVDAIKAEYPALMVITYANVQRVPDGTRIAADLFRLLYDDRFRTCLIKRSTGKPTIVGTPPQRRYMWPDITNPATRTLIATHVAAQVATTGTHGIWLDGFHGELLPSSPFAAVLDLGPLTSTIDTIVYKSDEGDASLTILADGAGPGSLTKAGSAFTFHFQSGVTTVAEFEAAIASSNGLGIVLAAPSPTATLGAGDVLATTTFRGGAAKAAAWAASGRSLLQEISAAMGGKFLGYNGLWNHLYLDQVVAQADFLDIADAATVEFYGFNATNKVPPNGDPFDTFVTQINAQILARPAKTIFVHGTTPDLYFTYEDNLRNARYCQAGYMLGPPTPGSAFFFSQDFQAGRLPRSRAGGLSAFSYCDLPLGQPLASAVDDGSGAFSREFEGGIVYIAPERRGLHTWVLANQMWTTTGTALAAGTTIALNEGDALFLLRVKPTPEQPIIVNVADSTKEWLVQNVTGEFRWPRCTLRVRSSDIASAVLIRVEVNDSPRPFAVLEVMPTNGRHVAGTTDIPYRQTTIQGAVHVPASVTYAVDGQWHNVELNLSMQLHAIKCFRVPSIRTVGAVEIGAIALHDPEPILPPLDPNAPIATFSHVVDSLSVHFTDASVDNYGTIESWAWDFGDGGSATSQNQTHVYTTVGGKSVTLTVTDNVGKTGTYTKTVFPTILTDGPNGTYIPRSVVDYNAIGLTPADSVYFPNDVVSGNWPDLIGSLNLMANAMVAADYRHAVGVTGWNLLGQRFNQAANQRMAVAPGIGPNPTATPSRLTILAKLTKPAAVSGVMSLGTNNTVRQLPSAKLRHVIGSPTSAADERTVYDGDVYLISLFNDPVGNAGNFETDQITPTVVAAAPYADPADAIKGIGGISPVTSAEMVVIWAEWRYSAPALAVTVQDICTRMHVIEEVA